MTCIVSSAALNSTHSLVVVVVVVVLVVVVVVTTTTTTTTTSITTPTTTTVLQYSKHSNKYSYMSSVYREISKRHSTVLITFRCHSHQWSFRKTGTMGTLASQAEIGVSVQALRGSGDITPGKKIEVDFLAS